jgi:hypothetical protein
MSMSESRDPRTLRVSHADRDRVVDILREAAADGRLESEELEERVEKALQARTFAEFEPLVEDLPVAPPLLPPASAPAPPVRTPADAAPAARDEVATWSVRGLPLRREGAWLVPRRIELDVQGGSARLDYTLARLPEGGASALHVNTYGGSVRLLVPPGVAVDLSGVSWHGGRLRDRSLRHVDPSVPVTHVITVTGGTHGGSIKVLSSEWVGDGRRRERRERRARRRGW